MAVGALGAVVLDDPLLQAVAMKYVFHVARQLHDAILVLEPFHADAAVEAFLEYQGPKSQLLPELLEGVRSSYATAV